ncbi:uncharacterized protein KY384_008531 [Bacidia gigantensis]|uniref:uncharacterized protein n=1 Tax=Bacidia gigantensis TaxID=2732470 RepID=UPI001D044578|nr:uncharacterized protein KY384_008531 [Bacidia gigantensis]KAG8527102.1 hypothetical protein KY384_008531 [Bacidia gigantensis]
MESRPKIYATAAFVAGALVCLAFKDVYPDLERRYRRRFGAKKTLKDTFHSVDDHVELQDRESQSLESLDVTSGIEGCIGNTPLIKIKSLSDATGCEILAKAEFMNGGGGSPKDRVALSIIDRVRCMPSDQAVEKSELLLKLGAIVERVPPAPIIDPEHFVNRARRLALKHAGNPELSGRGYFADQFENEANWHAHFDGTGPEIFRQCNGRVDAFVAGAGTGGTIAGVASYLEPRLPLVKVVLADPQGSGLYNRIKYGVMFDTREKEGTRRRQQVDSIVEGIGINRVTANFEVAREMIHDAVKVDDDQALAMAKWLVEKDGIFVGSSSAVNCVAATIYALKMGPGHRVVTILCDSGSRHLSKFWKMAGNVGAKTDTKLDEIVGSSP